MLLFDVFMEAEDRISECLSINIYLGLFPFFSRMIIISRLFYFGSLCLKIISINKVGCWLLPTAAGSAAPALMTTDAPMACVGAIGE